MRSPNALNTRIVDRIFGFDYFISYTWSDAETFAHGLYRALTKEIEGKHKLRVFLDKDVYQPGDDLRDQTERRVRSSSVLVLVLTPFALESEWVVREVEACLEAKHRVLPLNINRTWEEAKKGNRLIEALSKGGKKDILRMDLKVPTEKAEVLFKGSDAPVIADRLTEGPSKACVERILGSLAATNVETRRHRMVTATLVGLTFLALAATVFGVVAERNRRESQRNLVSSNLAIAQQGINQHRPAITFQALGEAVLAAAEKDERQYAARRQMAYLDHFMGAPVTLPNPVVSVAFNGDKRLALSSEAMVRSWLGDGAPVHATPIVGGVGTPVLVTETGVVLGLSDEGAFVHGLSENGPVLVPSQARVVSATTSGETLVAQRSNPNRVVSVEVRSGKESWAHETEYTVSGIRVIESLNRVVIFGYAGRRTRTHGVAEVLDLETGAPITPEPIRAYEGMAHDAHLFEIDGTPVLAIGGGRPAGLEGYVKFVDFSSKDEPKTWCELLRTPSRVEHIELDKAIDPKLLVVGTEKGVIHCCQDFRESVLKLSRVDRDPITVNLGLSLTDIKVSPDAYNLLVAFENQVREIQLTPPPPQAAPNLLPWKDTNVKANALKGLKEVNEKMEVASQTLSKRLLATGGRIYQDIRYEGADGIQLWDRNTGLPHGSVIPLEAEAEQLALSKEADLLAVLMWDGKVLIYDTLTRRQCAAYQTAGEKIRFNSNGNLEVFDNDGEGGMTIPILDPVQLEGGALEAWINTWLLGLPLN